MPIALHAILWFIGLIIAIFVVFEVVGMRLMCNYFPEGRKAWMLPAQLASLAFFAAVVLLHPF